MRWFWIVSLFSLVGCATRIEPIPDAARNQAPGAAAPDGPWKAHGRLAVTWPGHHLEMECYLRRDHGATLRYALLADGGISLAEGQIPWATRAPQVISDLSVSEAIPPKVHPDLASHINALERLIGESYQVGSPHDTMWSGNVRRQDARQSNSTPGNVGPIIGSRWYGGDPVLLRRVEGGGWPLQISDYRMTPLGLMAHHIRADGPLGAEITLRLDTVEALP